VVLSTRGQAEKLKLLVRPLGAGQEVPPEREYALRAPLAGTPGVWAKYLVLPLANGILVRQPLGDGMDIAGPEWRAARSEVGAEGHVVPAGGDDLLVTDGSRGLTLLSWPEGKDWKTRKKVSLPQRIVSAPVMLPRGKDGELRVCVADASNTVT